jgi:hypothetical protein
VELRGALTAADPAGRPSLLGPLAGLHRRAAVVGKSLAGLRTADVLRAVDVLAARPDVAGIDVFGRGPFAVPVLHAAVLDPRIRRVALEDALVSYRAVLDHPIHRDLPEVVLPGVLRHYDLDDLVLALAPRTVLVLNPVDAVGRPMRSVDVQRYLGDAIKAGPGLAAGERVRVTRRGRGEPIPWD